MFEFLFKSNEVFFPMVGCKMAAILFYWDNLPGVCGSFHSPGILFVVVIDALSMMAWLGSRTRIFSKRPGTLPLPAISVPSSDHPIQKFRRLASSSTDGVLSWKTCGHRTQIQIKIHIFPFIHTYMEWIFNMNTFHCNALHRCHIWHKQAIMVTW